MVEDNLEQRTMVIEFPLWQNEHFSYALKEFAIVNSFELKHIKTDLMDHSQLSNKNCTWHVYASIDRVHKVLQ